MSTEKFPIVVLISGNGSNLQAIIDAIKKNHWPIEIRAVISNRADAYGLQRAQAANIPTEILLLKNYANRVGFDQALSAAVARYQPKLVVLAGFMHILANQFVQHFYGRLINIHPSLLPNYKGTNTHQRVLAAGDRQHGCTVHVVTEELDSGAIIGQMECEVLPNDTVETLQQKVHQLEHQLYPEIIYQIAIGNIKLFNE